jgi:hypothetical protein
MRRVGFEPTVPVFEQPKTVSDSDHSAIGTGPIMLISNKINNYKEILLQIEGQSKL